jgi:hypothetical protein
MHRSITHASLADGDRPARGHDARRSVAHDQVMVPRIFLEDVLDTFNRVPNLRLNNERWRSTYGMAAALSEFLARAATPPPPRTAETDLPEGDG